jgi:hypothetical protein
MALDGATARGSANTVTTAAVFIPEIWGNEILKARENKLVMAKHVMTIRPEVIKFGDTVHMPRLGNETALDKTAESAITYSAATETEVQVLINKYKYVGKLIEDIVDIQSKYDLFANFRDKIAYALGDAVDASILALTGSIANSVGSHTAGSVYKTDILTAIRMLDSANAPQEDRYIVVDAYGRQDLLGIDDFVRYDAGGKAPSALINGEIGEIYGLTVLFSQNVGAPTATSAYGMVFHKDAFVLALQKDVTIKSEYSVDYLGMKLAGYEVYGVTYARTDHAVLLKYSQA